MKYRGSIIIATWTAFIFGDTFIHHKPILEAILVFLFLTPILLVFQPRLILSKSIVFMSIFTFLSIPAIVALIVVFINKTVSFQLLLPSICGVSTLIYLILLLKHKFSDEFLDNVKISLEIVRTLFAISLAVVTIYSLMHNDFSFFEKFIIDYDNKNLDEIKKIFQLVCQSIALPFVISSSLFKIVTDWIILFKKRGAMFHWYSALQKVRSLIRKLFSISNKSSKGNQNV